MAAQGFIQPLAQDAQQISPNNGNPNTVYNRAASAAPVQGWAANPITPAANYKGTDVSQTITQGNANTTGNSGWIAPTAPTTNPGQGMITLPEGWADALKKPTTPTTPTTPTPETPAPRPSIDWNKQWVVVTKGVPGKNNDLYNNDPAYRKAYDQAVAEHYNQFKKNYTKDSSVSAIENRLKQLYEVYYNQTPSTGGGTTTPTGEGSGGGGGGDAYRNPNGTPNINSVLDFVNNSTGSTNTGWNSNTNSSMSNNLSNYISSAINNLGANTSANGLLQFLDAVTEPFMPGNMYMSELGKVNMPNVLTSIMNKAIPGLGTLGKWLAGKIPMEAGGLLGTIRNFFLNGKFQEAANAIYKQYDMDKAREEAIKGPSQDMGGGGGGGFSGSGISGGFSGNMGGWSGLGLGGSGFGHGRKPDITVGETQQF